MEKQNIFETSDGFLPKGLKTVWAKKKTGGGANYLIKFKEKANPN